MEWLWQKVQWLDLVVTYLFSKPINSAVRNLNICIRWAFVMGLFFAEYFEHRNRPLEYFEGEVARVDHCFEKTAHFENFLQLFLSNEPKETAFLRVDAIDVELQFVDAPQSQSP